LISYINDNMKNNLPVELWLRIDELRKQIFKKRIDWLESNIKIIYDKDNVPNFEYNDDIIPPLEYNKYDKVFMILNDTNYNLKIINWEKYQE
jgi:hypothetical protein